MDMTQFLQRMDARRAALGLSDAALSMRAGAEKDLVRNWRRAAKSDSGSAPRIDSIESVAAVLGVPVSYLIGEQPGPTTAAPGFADHAAPFQFSPRAPARQDGPTTVTGDTILRPLYGDAARSPAMMRLLISLPAFSMLAGDVVIMDLSRLPAPGEIAVVAIIDEDTAHSSTLLCLYAPPLLIRGDQLPHLRVDNNAISVRYPIIGSLRGLPAEA